MKLSSKLFLLLISILSMFLFGKYSLHAMEQLSFSEISSAESPVQLILSFNGHSHKFKLEELKNKLKEQSFIVSTNPAYSNSSISYQGFDFKEILATFGESLNLDEFKIVVTCKDGYRPVLDPKLLRQGRAFLAFRETLPGKVGELTYDSLWSKVKMGESYVSPGPLYLVWDTITTYPTGWPFQIVEIALVPNSQLNNISPVAPIGAGNLELDSFNNSDNKSDYQSGYKSFTQNCSVCHSIRNVGPHGKAPDLGYVTGYRDDSYILNILEKGRGAMPSFKSILQEKDALNIIKYLKSSANTTSP